MRAERVEVIDGECTLRRGQAAENINCPLIITIEQVMEFLLCLLLHLIGVRRTTEFVFL